MIDQDFATMTAAYEDRMEAQSQRDERDMHEESAEMRQSQDQDCAVALATIEYLKGAMQKACWAVGPVFDTFNDANDDLLPPKLRLSITDHTSYVLPMVLGVLNDLDDEHIGAAELKRCIQVVLSLKAILEHEAEKVVALGSDEFIHTTLYANLTK